MAHFTWAIQGNQLSSWPWMARAGRAMTSKLKQNGPGNCSPGPLHSKTETKPYFFAAGFSGNATVFIGPMPVTKRMRSSSFDPSQWTLLAMSVAKLPAGSG